MHATGHGLDHAEGGRMMATVLPFPAPPPAMTPDRPDPAHDAD